MSEREAQYAQARQWMRELAAGRLASVSTRKPVGNVFLDVMIESQRFKGIHRSGTLYIAGPDGACPLGVASINRARRNGGPQAWHICKYRNEATCRLSLTPLGLRALAVTFGLPIVTQVRTFSRDLFEEDHFYDSPAFAALHVWAAKVPRAVAGLAGDSYLPQWPLAALAGVHLLVTADN